MCKHLCLGMRLRQARRGAGPSGAQMRRECVDMGRMLLLLKEGVCMIDEVVLSCSALKAEECRVESLRGTVLCPHVGV
eukprot:124422-Amphidinium_carterae.1